MYIVTLEAARHEQRMRIGSKALHLAALLAENIRIPSGFVITSTAFETFWAENNLSAITEEAHFPQKILQAKIPEAIHEQIAVSLEALRRFAPKLSVAVRSSSSAEDLPDASFAGQYETILNVTDLPHLLDSVKLCWSSLFSPSVKQYVSRRNNRIGSVPMAVLVQQMIFPDVSGVIFSVNPVSGNQNELVLNASYGLGEAIVSGLVTPDAFFVDRKSLQIHKELGGKEVKVVADSRETKTVQTASEEQQRFSLTDEQVSSLAKEALSIEALFRYPVDLEFAVKDGQIYILQARPITT
ncbi:PEP/pyruvate-binding domain-containing protein [Brevibacillus sp. H7]|uniref:PEP/pyruvate-binding domain-containing protein n=1 Tax=Brevibacillus sp. H7 TaxID=3349138 RepID=UPI003821299C